MKYKIGDKVRVVRIIPEEDQTNTMVSRLVGAAGVIEKIDFNRSNLETNKIPLGIKFNKKDIAKALLCKDEAEVRDNDLIWWFMEGEVVPHCRSGEQLLLFDVD